jgi:RNA polymerase sigma factor (sigma-70 family)
MHQLAVIRAEPDLVAAARSGDGTAFDALIGPHLETGYRTALAILRNPDEAHDAVQESAFKAWRRLGQLHQGAAIRPWFLAIVANQCRSVRRGRWWSVVPLPDSERGRQGIEESVVATTDIDRAMARLPREDRLVLFLHFYLDLPLDEIGAVLGLSANGAKTRIYRAARKLRPGLEMD